MRSYYPSVPRWDCRKCEKEVRPVVQCGAIDRYGVCQIVLSAVYRGIIKGAACAFKYSKIEFVVHTTALRAACSIDRGIICVNKSAI